MTPPGGQSAPVRPTDSRDREGRHRRVAGYHHHGDAEVVKFRITSAPSPRAADRSARSGRCSFIAAGGPAATAMTRMPWASSAFADASAPGDGSARATTAANAPLTMRRLAPSASVTVASDIRNAGSKGVNVTSLRLGAPGFRRGGGADREIDRVLPAFGAGEGGHREHIGFVERTQSAAPCRP